MKKTKKMYSGCYYLLKGEANANTCFVENLREAKLFIQLANRYLKNYVKIHEYLLTAEGWILQVTLRKKNQILHEYDNKRKNSSKETADKKEVWRVVSEQVRLMLSQYVIKTNRWEGREGSKIKESYKRYYFESAKEANAIIQKMKNQKFKMVQRNKKYRKIKTHFTIPKSLIKGCVFLCSKWVENRKKGNVSTKKVGLNYLNINILNNSLVAELTNKTFQTHQLQNSS